MSAPAVIDPKEFILSYFKARLSMPSAVNKKYTFSCMEDALTKHGAFFEPPAAGLPKKQLREQKQCFSNCMAMAHGLDGDAPHGPWTYVEGYACRGSLGMPVHHGWLIDKEGTVTDPTWRDLDGEQLAYLGIPIRPDYLKRHIARCFKLGEWRAILDNWQANFPVLTGEHPMRTVAWPTGRFPKAVRP